MGNLSTFVNGLKDPLTPWAALDCLEDNTARYDVGSLVEAGNTEAAKRAFQKRTEDELTEGQLTYAVREVGKILPLWKTYGWWIEEQQKAIQRFIDEVHYLFRKRELHFDDSGELQAWHVQGYDHASHYADVLRENVLPHGHLSPLLNSSEIDELINAVEAGYYRFERRENPWHKEGVTYASWIIAVNHWRAGEGYELRANGILSCNYMWYITLGRYFDRAVQVALQEGVITGEPHSLEDVRAILVRWRAKWEGENHYAI